MDKDGVRIALGTEMKQAFLNQVKKVLTSFLLRHPC